MVGARMVYFGLPDKKIWGIPAIKLTVMFVWLDITCFIVQLAGGSLLSNTDSKLANIGMKIYTTGVSLQLGFVVVFIVMMGCFYHLVYKTTNGNIGRLRFLIWAVLAVLCLIVVCVLSFSAFKTHQRQTLTRQNLLGSSGLSSNRVWLRLQGKQPFNLGREIPASSRCVPHGGWLCYPQCHASRACAEGT